MFRNALNTRKLPPCHCEAGKLRICASKAQLGNVAIFGKRLPRRRQKLFRTGGNLAGGIDCWIFR